VLSTKTYALILVAAVAGLVLLGVTAALLQRTAAYRDGVAFETPVKIFAFAAFVAMGLSAMPLLLRLFLAGQRHLGNAEHPLVRALAGHETLVVVGFWSMCLVGLAIAVPFAMKDGFFGPGARAWLETSLAGRSRGVLVANVGMTIDEVRRRSTLPVPEASAERLTGSTNLIAEVVFDLEIADTGTRFERCRYYFITTRPRGDRHVTSMNVGVSPRAWTRAELDEEMKRTQARLRADGWASGRYVYRRPEQIALHGGKTSAGEGYYWLKGEALIHLEPKRVDEEQRGEDPRAAGKWMLAVQISERSRTSTYEGMEFTSAPPR
jgi:hypothetical protein